MSSTVASEGGAGATLRTARSIYNANEMTLAMNVAKSRERCRWAGGYLSLLTVGSMGYWAMARKFPVGMLIPLSAVATYAMWEYDLGYGTKLHRMGQEAQQIQTKERYKYFGKY